MAETKCGGNPMNPSVCFPAIILLCGLFHPSTAPSTGRSSLMMSYLTWGINSSTPATPEDKNAMLDNSLEGGSELDAFSNTTGSLNSSSISPNLTATEDEGQLSSSVGAGGMLDTGVTNLLQAVSLTTEPWAAADRHGPNETQSSTAPSVIVASPSEEPLGPVSPLTEATPPTMDGSADLATKLGQRYFNTEKRTSRGKTLGVFIGLAVVLLVVLGLVYLIYTKSQKDDSFSHQRLYNSDPVLSLDVSVEPADRFYGGLAPGLGSEGQGDHVTSQKALSQVSGGTGDTLSKAQTSDEIQLKPMSESSVKVFL